jgi:diaminopimelate decarboxylase
MSTIHGIFTEQTNFFGSISPEKLVRKYGSPLYVYSEQILRERCRDITSLVDYPKFRVNYSAKANSNIELLKIMKSEGFLIDAMSPGEIHAELLAGYRAEEILYIGNNVSDEELRFAVDRGITVSVDSVSQLERFGKLNPGGKVAVRFNPGIGTGHHRKVITAGKGTKFGVDPAHIDDVKGIVSSYSLKLEGINQHIGSLFMKGGPYLLAAEALLAIASQFESLEFIDLGGGFGIPYHKQEGQKRLDLVKLGAKLTRIIHKWIASYGREITVKIEPGRYPVAECGVLLGMVHAVKMNYGDKYIGTDLGFNVLMRPVLYDSHHDIEIYRETGKKSEKDEKVTIVGNICETGDVITQHRSLPEIFEGDILGVMDAGAYGYVMSSNYNSRLRPAEVLIQIDGSDRLIRRRDTYEDLVKNL